MTTSKILKMLVRDSVFKSKKVWSLQSSFSPDTHLQAISLWCCFHWSVNKMRMLSILLNAIIILLKHCSLRFPFPTFLVLKLLFLWHIMLVLGRGCCCCLFVYLLMPLAENYLKADDFIWAPLKFFLSVFYKWQKTKKCCFTGCCPRLSEI